MGIPSLTTTTFPRDMLTQSGMVTGIDQLAYTLRVQVRLYQYVIPIPKDWMKHYKIGDAVSFVRTEGARIISHTPQTPTEIVAHITADGSVRTQGDERVFSSIAAWEASLSETDLANEDKRTP